MGVAQNSRATVTQVLVFGSIYQGAILAPLFEPQPHCLRRRAFLSGPSLLTGAYGRSFQRQNCFGWQPKPAWRGMAGRYQSAQNRMVKNPKGGNWTHPNSIISGAGG